MEPAQDPRGEGREPVAPAPPARERLGYGWAALAGGIALAVVVMLLVWLLT